MKWYNYLWELPQFLLCLIVMLFLTDKKDDGFYKDRRVIRFKKGKFFSGTSLCWILLPYDSEIMTVAHEWGHCMQSRDWGFLYLLVFGIPSLLNNLNGRKIHKYMTYNEVQKDYYTRYPEDDADRRGGVTWVNGERVFL